MKYELMKKIECNYCFNIYKSANAYKDHMRNQHPMQKLQKIILKENPDVSK